MTTKYDGLLSPHLMRRRVAMARPHLRGRILDVGCADGVLAREVAAGSYVGVDIDDAVLTDARRANPDHEFRRMRDLGPDDRFDTVAALAVVEHMPDARGWAARVREHLVPGGRIVLTTPHRRFEFVHDLAARVGLASPEAADEHEETFDRRTLTDLFEKAGLTLELYQRFLLGMNQLAIARRPTGR